jgi:hypothetical protein
MNRTYISESIAAESVTIKWSDGNIVQIIESKDFRIILRNGVPHSSVDAAIRTPYSERYCYEGECCPDNVITATHCKRWLESRKKE